jgi:hypothetical protein
VLTPPAWSAGPPPPRARARPDAGAAGPVREHRGGDRTTRSSRRPSPRELQPAAAWSWLAQGAAQYFSGQVPHLRAAIGRRLREGGDPAFPPRGATPHCWADVFDLLAREEGVEACVRLASRLNPGATPPRWRRRSTDAHSGTRTEPGAPIWPAGGVLAERAGPEPDDERDETEGPDERRQHLDGGAGQALGWGSSRSAWRSTSRAVRGSGGGHQHVARAGAR